jgi:hypothetical protein
VVDRGDVLSLFLFAFQVFVKREDQGLTLFAGLGRGTLGLCSLFRWLCWALRTENYGFFCAHICVEARHLRGKRVVERDDSEFCGKDLDLDC